MWNLLFLFILASPLAFAADSFEKESATLATALKTTLVQELRTQLAAKGAEEALGFCHANVKALARSAAKDYLDKYEFGRASHLVRNPQNRPAPWMQDYLARFRGLKQGDANARPVVHTLPDGKRVYLDPLFVQPLCLECHGENVRASLRQKIKVLYPADEAVGFKAGQFRGFVWVKEK